MATTSRHYVHFLDAGTVTITVTSPTPGQTLTTSAPLITWTLTGGTGIQGAFRVLVFADAAATTIVYDSGWIASAIESHIIPAGSIPTSATYYLRVDAQDTDGAQGESALVQFIADFAPSVNVTGVRAEATLCASAPLELPRIVVTWSQVVPGIGETFVQYIVRRREGGETTWTSVATSTDIATVHYVDYNAAPDVTYEYAVIWLAAFGADSLASREIAIAARLTFDHIWIHAVADTTYQVRLDAYDIAQDYPSAVTMREVWGRRAPSAEIGERDYVTLNIPAFPELIRDQRKWAMLRAMLALQRDEGAIFCYRHGRAKQRFFVTITASSLSVAQKTDAPTVSLVETHYEENVV